MLKELEQLRAYARQIKGRSGYALLPSPENPRVRRWQKRAQGRASFDSHSGLHFNLLQPTSLGAVQCYAPLRRTSVGCLRLKKLLFPRVRVSVAEFDQDTTRFFFRRVGLD